MYVVCLNFLVSWGYKPFTLSCVEFSSPSALERLKLEREKVCCWCWTKLCPSHWYRYDIKILSHGTWGKSCCLGGGKAGPMAYILHHLASISCLRYLWPEVVTLFCQTTDPALILLQRSKHPNNSTFIHPHQPFLLNFWHLTHNFVFQRAFYARLVFMGSSIVILLYNT